MQAGVEQTLLPSEPQSGFRDYFGLPEGLLSSSVEQQEQADQARCSALIPDSQAYDRLHSVFVAAVDEVSSQLGLNTTVLLQGPAKSGKISLVRASAVSVGLDIVVIDAFDLIGDTDVKTEGLLRARFDRSTQAAPCVLVLNNVEALARKSQAVETGQG